MSTLLKIREKLTQTGQLHLLKFYPLLEAELKEDFLEHLATLDFEEANNVYAKAIEALSGDAPKLDSRMKPVPAGRFESEEDISAQKLDTYRSIGLEEISLGHVGVILMAGGQGTRLGVSYPKGIYSVGLLSKKSLFQIQAERILRLQEISEEKTGRAGCITWYIMTSEATEQLTREFLEDHLFFGLNPQNVVIFEQGLLPCFDFAGKILLDDINRVCLAPNGNGGLYAALKDNRILEDMDRRSIKYVHVHSVDNILIKVADPVFVGYCVSKNAECGAKVVSKSDPSEPVGVICLVDDRFQVVEYSEITDSTAKLRDELGELVFKAGNICNHFFSTDFLKAIVENHLGDLKVHMAKKKMSCINAKGQKVTPESPNGIKIEAFVFDVFEFADKFVIWEVPRHSEFSAVKNCNAAGKDCPGTARRDLFALHKEYAENAGATVIGDDVEICPLLSYAGENLGHLDGRTFEAPVFISADET